MSFATTALTVRAGLAGAALLASLVSAAPEAGAVSLAVKLACASDYYAHCSQHAVGTPGVRQCMRAHASQLSQGCVTALIQSGEAGPAKPASKVASTN